MALVLPFLALLFAAVVIRYACDAFEPAADYLGRDLPAGVKGATINAIGSSLPELLTSFILLFEYADKDGFAAGVATCVGSAVFNVVVIPGVCVLAVAYIGVKQLDGSRRRITHIRLDRAFLLRNGAFFLLAELALIVVLDRPELVWVNGAMLIGVYAVYLGSLWGVTRNYEPPSERTAIYAVVKIPSKLEAYLTMDFNAVLFGSRAFSPSRAWTVMACAVAVLGVACHFLAQAVVDIADVMGIETYFAALILAAAATSIPDAILSIKDSLKGQYDDAIANAIGSNTFDIGIGIGLPLLVYTLINGPIPVSVTDDGGALRHLLHILVGITAFALFVLLVGKRVGRKRAAAMIMAYFGFGLWVLGSALEWWPS